MTPNQHWIPFEKGVYLLEEAFLVTPNYQAVQLQDARLEIYTGSAGRPLMRGFSKVKNLLIVALLEESDRIDLLLDLGGRYKYLLENPVLKAGKVFAPDVISTVQFVPDRPWRQISEDAFEQKRSKMVLLNRA
jgi:hypothetical protein